MVEIRVSDFISLKVPPEDEEWVRLLFERNLKPLKDLLDIGYEVHERVSAKVVRTP